MKRLILSFVFLALPLLTHSSAYSDTDLTGQKIKDYTPTEVQKSDSIKIIREQITKGITEGKTWAEEHKGEKQPSPAESDTYANELMIKLEKYQSRLKKAYGGPIMDGVFDDAESRFMKEDFSALNDQLGGKLTQENVDNYVTILKFNNQRDLLMDNSDSLVLLIHVKDEDLKNSGYEPEGENPAIADKMKKVVLEDFQRDRDYLKAHPDEFSVTPTVNPTPGVEEKTPREKEEDARREQVYQELWDQYGKNDKADDGLTLVRQSLFKADYLVLTKDRYDYEKKNHSPLSQSFVEARFTTYMMGYWVYGFRARLFTFDISVGQVLGDIAANAAVDVGTGVLKGLLHF